MVSESFSLLPSPRLCNLQFDRVIRQRLPEVLVASRNVGSHGVRRSGIIMGCNRIADQLVFCQYLLGARGTRAQQCDAEQDYQVIDLLKHPKQLRIRGAFSD
ncbi:hypothetical protein CBM2610_B50273 [Cupriavidus taiwanensis]|nr:hypothetical protein CBM2610_B50273 [Cupriavidus taiwanensis]